MQRLNWQVSPDLNGTLGRGTQGGSTGIYLPLIGPACGRLVCGLRKRLRWVWPMLQIPTPPCVLDLSAWYTRLSVCQGLNWRPFTAGSSFPLESTAAAVFTLCKWTLNLHFVFTKTLFTVTNTVLYRIWTNNVRIPLIRWAWETNLKAKGLSKMEIMVKTIGRQKTTGSAQ